MLLILYVNYLIQVFLNHSTNCFVSAFYNFNIIITVKREFVLRISYTNVRKRLVLLQFAASLNLLQLNVLLYLLRAIIVSQQVIYIIS